MGVNYLTATVSDKLSACEAEVSDWYNKHTKVEFEDGSKALRAEGIISTMDDEAGVIKSVTTEWKSETTFVVKRVE